MTDCKHHPGQDCSCYCRFFGCSPRNCSVGEAFEDEKPKPPKAEPFEPGMVLMPLDGTDGLILTNETRQWIASRLLKGDPGPLYGDRGRVWTEASEAERTAAQRVEVRMATDDEQREALDRELGRRGLVFRAADPVVGSTVTIRQAREEPMPAEGRSVLVLRRSGRDVERITGTILAGRRGYVVRAEGVAVEAARSGTNPALVGVALVHRRVDYPGDEAAQHEGIEPHCELVGGACKSRGPAWQFYQRAEVAMEGWVADEPPAAFWQVLEEELERWIGVLKESADDCLPGGLSAVVLGYRALLQAWDEARRRAGGEFGEMEESAWGSALDTVWRAFTEEEMEAYEKWRLIERAAGVVAGAPADAVVDTEKLHDEG